MVSCCVALFFVMSVISAFLFAKNCCRIRLKGSTSIASVSSVKKRVLSGIQPTGVLHIGNYFGALRQWSKNQDNFENYFMVVDLHALTAVTKSPSTLSRETLQTIALYLAAGIDPAKSIVFIQSHISAHAELCWLLNCVTPLGWLERMTQFKDKSSVVNAESLDMGLLSYPMLMAADILLYKADLVPVGDDQLQHLELTRDIMRRFNHIYCKNTTGIFKRPNALVSVDGARIMSLQDGRSKMSKSAENDYSRINMLDSPDLIRDKIKCCKTDAVVGLEFDNPERPEATNLLSIYQCVTGRTKEEIATEVAPMKWSNFKSLLAEATIAHLTPIQKRYYDLMENREYLHEVVRNGKVSASKVAEETLQSVKSVMGLIV